MSAFEWICRFCERAQMATPLNFKSGAVPFDIGQCRGGHKMLEWTAFRCTNPDCLELTLSVGVVKAMKHAGTWLSAGNLRSWALLPDSAALQQPEYIPEALRSDYEEACLIRDLSPKASATLARRCLQGMIRDFCGIQKARLIDEIGELRKRVDENSAPRGVEPEHVEAIDAVRGVGNIGAHMEKDISIIVEVDPGEAQALIELIEMLFSEWYVARHKRQQKLASVHKVAQEKKKELADQKAAVLQIAGPANEPTS